METSREQGPDDGELTAEERGRLWEHGLHLGTMLFQRVVTFLVAESLVLVSYTSTLTAVATLRSDRPVVTARVIAGFGVLLTVTWAYVGHRHLQYYRLVNRKMRENLPDYRSLRAQWRKSGPTSLPLITYVLPLLTVALWLLLLGLTWR